MNQSTNLLLSLVPKELLGSVLLLMMMAGGLAIVVGARKIGQALVISAIAFPVVGVISAALLNTIFGALPPELARMARAVAAVLVFAALAWMIIKWIFGEEAVNQAKGELLADAIRGIFRFMFSRAGLAIAFGLVLLAYVRAG